VNVEVLLVNRDMLSNDQNYVQQQQQQQQQQPPAMTYDFFVSSAVLSKQGSSSTIWLQQLFQWRVFPIVQRKGLVGRFDINTVCGLVKRAQVRITH
jgi:hypothetical protein